jgi:hypothetical protein
MPRWTVVTACHCILTANVTCYVRQAVQKEKIAFSIWPLAIFMAAFYANYVLWPNPGVCSRLAIIALENSHMNAGVERCAVFTLHPKSILLFAMNSA